MKKYICFLLVALTAVTCSRYPYEVEQALKLAGDNRAELECVLERYRAYPEEGKGKSNFQPNFINKTTSVADG